MKNWGSNFRGELPVTLIPFVNKYDCLWLALTLLVFSNSPLEKFLITLKCLSNGVVVHV